jgi:Mrp family chromosome partitioning ATPase
MTVPVNLLRQIERKLRLPTANSAEWMDFGHWSPADLYQPLVRKFAQIREAQRDGATFAFTSISPGEGVSFVTAQIARELAQHAGEKVLVTTAESLHALAPVHLGEIEFGAQPGAKVWRLAHRQSAMDIQPLGFRMEALQILRKRFGYVLVDCPALRESGAVIPAARASAGLILVVAAAETRRDHVEQAQSALEDAGCHLLGLVLNKRREAVPKFLYPYF